MNISPSKRSHSPSSQSSNASHPESPSKKLRMEPSQDAGSWPAPAQAIEEARQFLRECAQAGRKTIIVPDKDADGLCGGSIIYRTL
ncbi:hypothetical protein FRB90_005235, partial [Tulasnella sp. 427]